MLLTALLALAATVSAAPAARDIARGPAIQLKDTNFCLDNTNSNTTDGNILQLWECTHGNTNQGWLWETQEVYNGIQLYKIRLEGTNSCIAYKKPASGSAAGAYIRIASCDSDLNTYYTKWRWDGDWICSGLGRCWGVQAQEPRNGVTLGLTTTGNAHWVQVTE